MVSKVTTKYLKVIGLTLCLDMLDIQILCSRMSVSLNAGILYMDKFRTYSHLWHAIKTCFLFPKCFPVLLQQFKRKTVLCI